nr:MAG TPA: hypothetical protein [Caudoviricetes sp.]
MLGQSFLLDGQFINFDLKIVFKSLIYPTLLSPSLPDPILFVNVATHISG